MKKCEKVSKSGDQLNSKDAKVEKKTCNEEEQLRNEVPTENLRYKQDNKYDPIEIRYKIFVFLCAAFFTFGSHFAGLSYGHLKTKLKNNLGWTNTQFGITQAASKIPNLIFPFFAGLLLDHFGTTYGPLMTTFFFLFGTILSAVGLNCASFPLVTVGRFFYGLGTCSASIIQHMIIAQWFEGRNFTTIFSLILAFNNFGSFLGSVTMLGASSDDNLAGGTYLAVSVCIISFIFTIFYLIGMKKMGSTSSTILKSKTSPRKPLSWRSFLHLPYTLWFLILIFTFLTGVQRCFMSFATDFYSKRDHSSDFLATDKISITLGVSMLSYPLLGKVLDHFGKKMYFVLTACILSTLVFSFLMFPNASPYLIMVLLSFSVSLKALSMLTSIPSIVPFAHIGAAYALCRSAGAAVAVLLDAFAGIIQDRNETDDYDEVIYMFVAICALTFLVAIVWLFFDIRYHGSSMLQSREQYLDFIKKKRRKENELGGDVTLLSKKRIIFTGICYFTYFSVMMAGLCYFCFLSFGR